jgi:hypothetical protein
MNLKRTLLVFSMAVALVGFMAAGSAMAAPILDFGDGGLSSTLGAVTSSGGVVTGSNIPIGSLKFINTPLNAGTYGIPATDLSFNFSTSGSISASINGGPTTNYDFDLVVKNSVTIVGTTSTFTLNAGTVLLAGNFTDITTNTINSLGTGQFSASGIDTKDNNLLVAAGIPTGMPFDLSTFNYTSDGSDYSYDISNTAVPEPSTLLLFGVGLLGLGIVGLKRKQEA